MGWTASGMVMDALRGWSSAQKHVVAASFLGWTLDAFDFFLLVFVIKDVSAEFGTLVSSVTLAVTLTLALRPVGAFIFGRLADRFGRRPILMIDVLLYSILGFATAFAPNLTVFLIVRALFGVAMGGEWGIGASLTMETVKPEARGFVSGLLQSGYPTGYLIASVVYGLLYAHIGWRGLFMVGIVPALLILYIRRSVPESPGWNRERASAATVFGILAKHWQIALYSIVLMTAFNFFSHGTQDLYPTFLQKQRHFDHLTVSTIAVVYNIGAIIGGLSFGALSQSFGRRRTMITAALLSIPAVYLWAYSETAVLLGLGAFLVQFFVQGAWGVVPAHLNEVSPPEARGAFPGTVYQLGNFIASYNLTLQARIAESQGNDYRLALAGVAVIAALAVSLFAWLSREARHISMTEGA